MKRLFSVILSMVFLLSGLINIAFATETEQLLNNIAPRGTAYSSSEKNSLWTPAKTINDGVSEGTWEGWECAYPTVSKGQDTSNGFLNEYCGIDFGTDFFEISSVRISLGIHRLLGGQNAKYELNALVNGKWQTVATFMDSDTTPHNTEKHPTYEDIIADESAGHRTLAHHTITLDTPVSTNNFRLCASEFGKHYEGGDVQVFPYIYEIELYGKEVNAPEIILPEGATATTNIAWYSYPEASSSQINKYPYLAIDEDSSTYWTSADNDEKPTFTLLLDNTYSIGNVELNLNKELSYSDICIEIRVDGNWQQLLITPTSLNENHYQSLVYLFDAEPLKADAVRATFNTTEEVKLYALEVHLNDTKTYYFDNRFDASQAESASQGNLAIIGKPYASKSFTPYSNVNYINDGLKDKQWFTGTIDVPAYCGLTFDLPQRISKVVITAKSIYTYGIEAMSFEIQALINGEFVKLADGKSYCQETGYTTTYTFDEVETTDVRIVITEMGGAIPNIAELELFNKENNVLPMFNGIEKVIDEEGCINTENSVITDHICEQSIPEYVVPTIVSVSVALIIVIGLIITLIVIRKKKKEV